MANASDEDRTGDLLIQEVDEDLRNEQYLKLARRYGGWAIAAAILLVAAVGAWQGWKGWQERQRQEAAAKYAAAAALIDAGKTKEAEDAFAKMSHDDAGFAALAGMRRADLLAKGGDAKGAMAAYEEMAASSNLPKTLRELATVKEGLLALNLSGDTSAVEARLGAVAVAGDPWYYEASEQLALFAVKKGDTRHAIDMFKRLADDPQAPSGVRAQATEMLAALGPSQKSDTSASPQKSDAAAPAQGSTAPAASATPHTVAPEKAPTPVPQDKK